MRLEWVGRKLGMEHERMRLRVAPDSVGAWEREFQIDENLGRMYDEAQFFLHQGFYDRAASIASELADILPTHPYVNNLLGVIFCHRDRPESGLERFQRALDHSAEIHKGLRSSVLSNRGGAKIKLGRIEEAERDFMKSLEYNPNNPGVFQNLGDIRFREEKYELAIQFYETAVEGGLQHRPPLNCVSSSLLRIMACFKRLGRDDESKQIAEIAKMFRPEHAYLIRESLTNRRATFYNRDLAGESPQAG